MLTCRSVIGLRLPDAWGGFVETVRVGATSGVSADGRRERIACASRSSLWGRTASSPSHPDDRVIMPSTDEPPVAPTFVNHCCLSERGGWPAGDRSRLPVF